MNTRRVHPQRQLRAKLFFANIFSGNRSRLEEKTVYIFYSINYSLSALSLCLSRQAVTMSFFQNCFCQFRNFIAAGYLLWPRSNTIPKPMTRDGLHYQAHDLWIAYFYEYKRALCRRRTQHTYYMYKSNRDNATTICLLRYIFCIMQFSHGFV